MLSQHELHQIIFTDVLDSYGLKYFVTSQKNANFKCPFHNDSNPSCGMNVENGLWKCFGCGASGNVVQFVSAIEDIEITEAEKKIRQQYIQKVIDTDSLEGRVHDILNKKPEISQPDPTYSEWILSKYTKNWEYMHSRGFTDQALEHFNVVYDPTTHYQGFPCYDIRGKLVGVTGRNTEGGEPRYFPLIRFSKSHFLYNLNKIDVSQPVIAVEGEINCIAMYQHGYANTVAFLGAGVAQNQIEIVKNSGIKELIIFFDTDPAGEHGVKKIMSELWTYVRIKIVENHDKDPAEMSDEEVKQLVEHAEDFTIDLS